MINIQRECYRCFVSGLIILFCTLCLHAKNSKPNIIFILADDMSYRDLSCYGQEQYSTPNIDALAQSGVRFSQAYAASAECAPSRSSLMTGLHTGHGPIRANSSARGQDNLRDEDLTIAEVLKEAGYTTAFTGKWGIGLPGTEGVPYKQGFDYTFGFYDQTRAHTYIPDFLWENDHKILYPQNSGFEMKRRYDYKNNRPQNTYDEDGKLYIEELKDPYDFVYSENEIQDAALRFIEVQKDEPYFLYYATQLPHGPVISDDMFGLHQLDTINQLSREWGAMVLKLDHFVGELVETLKASGQYEQTIIFFASDNGYSMCGYTDRGNGPHWPDDEWLKNKGPFTGGKFSVKEGGCRIPFFINWPNVTSSACYNVPVWLPDFFPTAAALAGLNIDPQSTDGKSLLPLILGDVENYEPHEHLYFSKNREQAVRIGPWKAYRKNPNSRTALYLIEDDTYTQKDLAHIYPEVVAQAEDIFDSEFFPSEWYWCPNESAKAYKLKKEKAIKTGNILPVYRPNGIDEFPWEKKSQVH